MIERKKVNERKKKKGRKEERDKEFAPSLENQDLWRVLCGFPRLAWGLENSGNKDRSRKCEGGRLGARLVRTVGGAADTTPVRTCRYVPFLNTEVLSMISNDFIAFFLEKSAAG